MVILPERDQKEIVFASTKLINMIYFIYVCKRFKEISEIVRVSYIYLQSWVGSIYKIFNELVLELFYIHYNTNFTVWACHMLI